MALEIGMNLVCSVLEQVVMCVCQYLFMSANAQTIHRKKIWYFFGFTALGASVYGAAFLTGLTGNLWIGVQIRECYHALQNVFHDSCDSGCCYVEKETAGNRNGKLADTAPFITSAF